MRRSSLHNGSLLLLAALTWACADAPSGPAAATPRLPGGTLAGMPAGAPSLDVVIDAVAPDSLSVDFTVTPSGGTFVFGRHAVVFPANSICDASAEGYAYGPEHWDEPCQPAQGPVSFHAEVRRDGGREWLDFTPQVRFVPTDDPAQYVWVLMRNDALQTVDPTDTEALKAFGIAYSPVIGAEPVDEAVADPSLRTYLYLAGGVAFRRIKHFSGYNINLNCGGFTFDFSDVLPVEF
jgi:hypothetical protein